MKRIETVNAIKPDSINASKKPFFSAGKKLLLLPSNNNNEKDHNSVINTGPIRKIPAVNKTKMTGRV
ncbi:hypothetical protein QMS90_17835 [Cronobacter sakazakii]|uniref:hypothetical protein n=1 Tax=Cronobacter sakazakii TaxID=28141 RepID=UPI001055FA67|nr:hypothetical protein [Cronobacter sakazakii]ELY2627414.1 hypothetical protein [Cronobacter sakazakii]EME2025146.1 hypothetical protein [Cronobacter sakazakii]EME2063509.1 hypothetical protein [Cronobacter sakazakii]EME2110707.1 hypothetical protein [Cronobacter sakazakii]KAB1477461.1 hypothetical protein AUM88_09225 [Cronobacter sakazakii]